MFLPFGSLFNPSADEIDLSLIQLPSRIDGRQAHCFILGRDTPEHLALFEAARDNRPMSLEIRKGAGFCVKSQLRLPVGFIRTMTGKTGVRENGSNIAVELNNLREGAVCGAGMACK